ncbi:MULTISPECIES: aminotransferase class I/II-fold pyridoxal phosphate-dependent enzyme [Pseudomonas]|jgi:aspartate/methionine/tyrosine aminotransferase|uniref:aminotransferase class I/II-fold pyridoxal phosphate-dependent enzyme n=1 Tax=Pseudomonas TaxID=286 RepID=UPI001474F160|nr:MULTISPECIES: aminotransferase class I/II-fold pyridoxal phosphate-dependent enzyme [Pseudomonas]NNA56562.1 aminotransferase class I/II-fold pyridoxal phosphate-dependent enzyme [Pseudomonas koreensis]
MKRSPDHKNKNLTELEVFGLSAQYNLADGHSYISAKTHYQPVLSALPELWNLAADTSVPQMEKEFKDKFAEYFGLDGLRQHECFSICPTASNSIDIVGAWARAMEYRVGLVEPTFDNLAQLLRRREVELEPIPESTINDIQALKQLIQQKQLNAVFLVNPNNPTGLVINQSLMTEIIDLCKQLDVVLILDTSFRFCHRTHVDEYALLTEKKLSFIILEDSGKQWPTLDTKASLLSYSADIAPLIRNIYEEIYLCSSNLSLKLISAFIEHTISLGGVSYIHGLIMKNAQTVREQLANTLVSIEEVDPDSTMTIMWLNIERTGMTDLELINYLAQYDVAALPGRYFYWNSHHVAGHDRLRIALMKPDEQFAFSISRLRHALEVLEVEIAEARTPCLEGA